MAMSRTKLCEIEIHEHIFQRHRKATAGILYVHVYMHIILVVLFYEEILSF